jgi:hypothetical protein
LPAPGAAVTTAARDRRTRSTISSTKASTGSGINLEGYTVALTPTGQLTPVPPRPQ